MTLNQFIFLATFYIALCPVALVNGEVFTAMTDMEHLLTLEGKLVRRLNNFIDDRDRTLDYLIEYLYIISIEYFLINVISLLDALAIILATIPIRSNIFQAMSPIHCTHFC